jgi:DNA-binding XRE family transcriptional regulator
MVRSGLCAPGSGMMEHKKDNAAPAGKPTGAGDAQQKPGAEEDPRAARVATDREDADDGIRAPAHPVRNKLREYRIENMMSKAELARKAGLSVLTVARIEKGYDCRMDTKRKLLRALGLKLADRRKVFEDE